MANIAVLYGSYRNHRQGIKGAKFVVNKLKERGHDINLVDAKESNLPFLNKMHKEYDKGKAPKEMEAISKTLRNADGFMIVTGEYNHGLPSGLKNLLDHFQTEYFFKPSAIACYSAGSFGGVRAAVHLRAVLCELGMPSIPSLFPMSKVQSSFDDDGKALDESYDKRITRFLDEFEWYVNALKEQRKKGIPY